MGYRSQTIPDNYIVQLGESGAVQSVSLRSIEQVIDEDTGASILDKTTVTPVIDVASGTTQTDAQRELLRTLIASLNAALNEVGSGVQQTVSG